MLKYGGNSAFNIMDNLGSRPHLCQPVKSKSPQSYKKKQKHANLFCFFTPKPHKIKQSTLQSSHRPQHSLHLLGGYKILFC